LIVTIARKGYRFTVDVTVAEAADSAKQAVVQVPAVKSCQPMRKPSSSFRQTLRSEGAMALVETYRRRRICLNFDGRRLYVLAALSG